MNPSIQEATLLLEKVEKKKREHDRAQGKLDQILSQLKYEFNCNSLVQATKKLKELESELVDSEGELKALLEGFQEKYQSKLEGL